MSFRTADFSEPLPDGDFDGVGAGLRWWCTGAGLAWWRAGAGLAWWRGGAALGLWRTGAEGNTVGAGTFSALLCRCTDRAVTDGRGLAVGVLLLLWLLWLLLGGCVVIG